MASENTIPAEPPISPPPAESEPLLGRPGDATQKDDGLLVRNLVLGKLPASAASFP